VAPGTLVKDWHEGDRHYFRYEANEPILNFWSIQSANYAKVDDHWGDVALTVLHHPPHSAQVPRMLEAAKAALDHNSKAYGPYPWRQLRLVEFPYANLAQAFAGTVPVSETAGFIADPIELAKYDAVWHVIAHEVAHQWFAHQIISANVPGATFLSETLAEYSALMTIQKQFGRDRVRAFLKHDLDKYLTDRGAATAGRELPLAQVSTSQPYVAYEKGGIAMVALAQTIGEDAVDRALAKLIARFRFKSDPYPVAADLIAALRAEAGPQYQTLITDLFERIVEWNFDLNSAESSKGDDGKWHTTLSFSVSKLESDGIGRTSPLPLDETVRVAVYSSDPKTAFGSGSVLAESRVHVTSSETTTTLVTEQRPGYAAVNPDLILPQRDVEVRVLEVE
jgi:ABC-2 type transport system permease protein